MRLEEFDYHLPKELIAQTAARPRDHSRLLVLSRTGADSKQAIAGKKALKIPSKEGFTIEHKHFYDLVDYLGKGDCLVLNNSKVFPARLLGKKKDTGGKIEILLLREMLNEKIARVSPRSRWQCLVGGNGRKENMIVDFPRGLRAEIKKNNDDGTWEVAFNSGGKRMMDVIRKIGLMPLPPYIKRDKKQMRDVSRYQTIYAADKKIGSVAAPTAGLHFTPRLIRALKKKGVQFEYVTLHVGLGTFASVKTEKIEKHKMHSEWAEIGRAALKRIQKAKEEGRRVIAVGTTSTRTLETAFGTGETKDGYSGWTDIFIYPGYKFKAIDGMITNFHLPKSTLLMLVSALCSQGASLPIGRSGASGGAGVKIIKQAYHEAIKRRYRFFSYGDAMLIT